MTKIPGTTIRVLFYRYGSICEPDVIDCFRQAGLTVVEEQTQITQKKTTASQTADAVSKLLSAERFLFVFTINFFPAISEVCRIHDIPYVCWTVDSPVMELFSPSLENDCNRIFLFDRAQYEYFKKRNPERIFHLPLCTNVARWDKVIREARASLKKSFAADVSFVGSLYHEHNTYPRLTKLSDFTKGYIEGLAEAQLHVYGYNFLEETLPERVLNDVKTTYPEVESRLFEGGEAALRYYVAHTLIGFDLAVTERKRLLEALAGVCNVDLYTQSDASSLSGVRVHGGVKTLTEMPLVFHESKINLNFTMRPIITGLPLRVFDVCGCGGFLMTNYQEELAEHFEPGVEAEYFTSKEEFLDKVSYYLSHDAERAQIARKGYERVKAGHTYAHRVTEMVRMVMGTL